MSEAPQGRDAARVHLAAAESVLRSLKGRRRERPPAALGWRTARIAVERLTRALETWAAAGEAPRRPDWERRRREVEARLLKVEESLRELERRQEELDLLWERAAAEVDASEQARLLLAEDAGGAPSRLPSLAAGVERLAGLWERLRADRRSAERERERFETAWRWLPAAADRVGRAVPAQVSGEWAALARRLRELDRRRRAEKPAADAAPEELLEERRRHDQARAAAEQLGDAVREASAREEAAAEREQAAVAESARWQGLYATAREAAESLRREAAEASRRVAALEAGLGEARGAAADASARAARLEEERDGLRAAAHAERSALQRTLEDTEEDRRERVAAIGAERARLLDAAAAAEGEAAAARRRAETAAAASLAAEDASRRAEAALGEARREAERARAAEAALRLELERQRARQAERDLEEGRLAHRVIEAERVSRQASQTLEEERRAFDRRAAELERLASAQAMRRERDEALARAQALESGLAAEGALVERLAGLLGKAQAWGESARQAWQESAAALGASLEQRERELRAAVAGLSEAMAKVPAPAPAPPEPARAEPLAEVRREPEIWEAQDKTVVLPPARASAPAPAQGPAQPDWARLAPLLADPLAEAAARLREAALQGPSDEVLVCMRAAAAQLARALDALRTLRALNGAAEPLSVTRLDEAAAKALSGWREPFEERKIELVVEVPKGLAASAASEGLALVLYQLTRNAFDAMRGGGKLKVSGGKDEAGPWLKVSDSGSGLPEGLSVEPFRWASPGRLGLGLAASSAVMKRMGGKLELGGGPYGAEVTLRFGAAD